jgi:hypothetical protein
MKTSESVSGIFKAQIKLQAEMTNIAKDSKGYGYNYTSLEKLIDHCRKPLAENGLGFIQSNTSTEDGKIGVTTRLIHDSGEWVEDTMTANLYKLAKMNEYQVAGSIITYFRRYALASMLGIASDEDIDASGEQQVVKTPPPSKATDGDKKQAWKDFQSICTTMGVDATEFMESNMDMSDKNAVYAEVRKWLGNEQLLRDQLLVYKNS